MFILSITLMFLLLDLSFLSTYDLYITACLTISVPALTKMIALSLFSFFFLSIPSLFLRLYPNSSINLVR